MYALRDEVWKSARGSNDVDVGGVMADLRHAIDALTSLAQPPQALEAASEDAKPFIPRTPAEVRDFLRSNCNWLRWGDPANPDTATEDDTYELTAHDLLSAFEWAGHYDEELAAAMAQTKEQE
jgi:hypothetical protein